MQNSTLPKFEISIFGKFGFPKTRKPAHENIEKYKIGTSNSISILNFEAGNLIFKIPKSSSLISLESQFETIKFEFSDLKNPEILIFASKLNFFFDQNLDFVLGPENQFSC